jgi:hypothetical protein
VSVFGGDHTATREVSAYTDAKGVVRLFAEAARDWRGWQGAKVWESLEGELRLEMTIDRSGHVTFRVQMWSTFKHDEWRLDTRIGLDAGSLEALASEARRLWGQE